jgi:hypothetical protein
VSVQGGKRSIYGVLMPVAVTLLVAFPITYLTLHRPRSPGR